MQKIKSLKDAVIMSHEIINLLIKYEMLMAKLYNVCADTFPDLESFWKELAEEEVKHASTIKELMSEVDNRKVRFKERRFNIRPLEISIEHASNIMKRVADKELDLLGTLSLTYDIEKSLIESRYYEIFSSTSREFNDRLKSVRDESRNQTDR